jgi:putative restriction endonuclease
MPEILHQINQITTYVEGESRAIHKPLSMLILLGKYYNSSDRLIGFQEFSEIFGSLIKQFGTMRTKNNPHYPFWRLRNDGFIWEVTDAENLEINASGDVRTSELLAKHTKAGFSDEAYQELTTNRAQIIAAAQTILNNHFDETLHSEILEAVSISVEYLAHRPRDPKFRKKILKAYRYKCAVCGFDIHLNDNSICIEAAHVKWHAAGGEETESNGLALCTLHHKLLDKGAFSLSNDHRLLASDELSGSKGLTTHILQYHGKKISLPIRPEFLVSQESIIWHMNEVLYGDPLDISTSA